MHWQQIPKAQGKLIVVISGMILDVVIPLGENVPKIFSYTLGENDCLWVPPHYAHGFYSMSDSKVIYLVDNEYSPELERGVNPMCKELSIDWGVPHPHCIDRDLNRPSWSNRFA
jgi:dTDP-4-dehydrorhamnose 3,5-epimerase